MQTSGLVLDVYDDHDGATLKALWPSREAVPDGIKQAHFAAADLRDQLPDDAFALVLLDEGTKLRKYACIDEGNTALSIAYFFQHGHKLPDEAQKTAAANLVTACGWYGLDAPAALTKIAMGVGGLLNLATTVPGAAVGIKNNLATDKALRAQGAGVITPEMRTQAQVQKVADINGTPLAPNQPPGVLKVDPSKAVVPKTAHLRPYVDVTGKTASARQVEVLPTLYAVPSQQLYPLDSYTQVKTASEYFNEYVHHMPPAMRREYAANLVKRASALDIPVGEDARRYGADGFAPDDEIKAAFDLRRLEVHGDPELFKLLGEVEKVARHRIWQEGEKIATTQDPEQVVYLLAEFDKLAGLDKHYDRAIPDPYFSIYGSEKTASDEMWSDVIGNDYVNTTDLKRLASENVSRVIKRFGEDFQKEFLKDPVGIYKSLPIEQKKILIHMAQSSAPGEPL